MRKLVLSAVVVLSFIVSSCNNKTEATPNKNEAPEQPLATESEITTNTDSSTSQNSYVVLMDNGSPKTINLDSNETIIAANNLPTNAQNFVTQNFGNVEFQYAVKEVEHNIPSFKIQLKDGTKIEFDENGEWEEVKNDLRKGIPTKFFPENIKKYLEKNYAKIDAKSIEKDVKDREIKVDLLQNNVDLKFDLDGNFIKID